MDKIEFLSKLEQSLSVLEEEELRDIINEYEQHIDMKTQTGLTEEEAIAILKGLRPNYEEYHRVTITDEAMAAAVELSKRYISDRFLPDKENPHIHGTDDGAVYIVDGAADNGGKRALHAGCG